MADFVTSEVEGSGITRVTLFLHEKHSKGFVVHFDSHSLLPFSRNDIV